MGNSHKFSIIVPVYNNAKFLKDCLRSIDKATVGLDKEVILINDGSTDESPEICDSFAEDRHDIIVIHKKNEGVSVARNCGINASSGDVIFFVDSDDLVELDYFIQMDLKSNEDFVYGGFKSFNSMGKIQTVQYLPENNTVISLRKNLGLRWMSCPMIFCHNACYKKEIIDKYNIRFDVGMKLGEDTKFNMDYLNVIQTYRVSDNTGYLYRINRASAVHQFYEKRLEKEEDEIRLLEQFSRDDENFDRLKWYYWHVILQHYYYHFSIASGMKKKMIRALINKTFLNKYFRSSISYIRKKGSLDERIETYLMSYQLRKLYIIILKILKQYCRIKERLS